MAPGWSTRHRLNCFPPPHHTPRPGQERTCACTSSTAAPCDPPSRRLVNGTDSLWRSGRLVCHCLLIETDTSLVLIDTGIRLGAGPHTWIGGRFGRLNRPLLDPSRPRGGRCNGSATSPTTYATSCRPTWTATTPAAAPTSPTRTSTCPGPICTPRLPRATVREQSRYLTRLWAHQPR
jgi:hypothetical protein